MLFVPLFVKQWPLLSGSVDVELDAVFEKGDVKVAAVWSCCCTMFSPLASLASTVEMDGEQETERKTITALLANVSLH